MLGATLSLTGILVVLTAVPELDRRVRLFLEKHLLGKTDVTISSEPVKDERRARPK